MTTTQSGGRDRLGGVPQPVDTEGGQTKSEAGKDSHLRRSSIGSRTYLFKAELAPTHFG
jgi:hypothetical protein